ncbi:MAG: methyltransferase domain-containing protein [Patescibacteria group bacterium]|nr:methyltransferase domain-containing protein [Patescibacteria group bacterium]
MAKTGQPSLADLIGYDGFDSKIGRITEAEWRKYVSQTIAKLRISKNDKILEIGCGAGAFLLPLYEQGYNVAGLDYSQSLLDAAKKVLVGANLVCGQANNLPFKNGEFDVVISNSIFHYLPSIDYAAKVLNEMFRVLNQSGRAAVLDINDQAKQDFAEDLRRKEIGNKEYEEKYKGLGQLYYPKSFFENFAEEHDIKFVIEPQVIDGYQNSLWRYNFYFYKSSL